MDEKEKSNAAGIDGITRTAASRKSIGILVGFKCFKLLCVANESIVNN